MRKKLTTIAGLLFWIHFAALGQVTVTPDMHVFDPVQVRYGSGAKELQIQNNGSETLHLLPEDVTLSGKHAIETNLSVVSYNIESDKGNWPGRLAYILQELRHHDVDIIGLQEVIQRSTLPNQAMQMADSLGFYYYFDSVDGEDNAQRYGNAILSRFPILATNMRRLEPLNRFRTAIHASIDVNGHLVDVYNTHLHHKGLDGHIRDEQISDLLDFVEQSRTSEVAFLTGDFNANPDWEEMQQLYPVFKDVYPLFHPDHLAPEHATLNGRVGHQMRRIDYVFFSAANDFSIQPLAANLILNFEHEDEQLVSDHFGVLGSFLLRADDAHFHAEVPTAGLFLLPGESAMLGVLFRPLTTGLKEGLLTVMGQNVLLVGEGFDASVYSLPWQEDFNNTQPPLLPLGWNTNSQGWKTLGTGVPEDHSARLVFDAAEASAGSWSVVSPPVYTTELDSLVLSFKLVAAYTGFPGNSNLRLYIRTAEEVHFVAQWSDINSLPVAGNASYTIYAADHGTGTQQPIFLEWQATKNGNDLSAWYIDDLVITPLQALSVSPHLSFFAEQQTGTSSHPTTFTLSNAGGGILTLLPEDISITGPNASDFNLINIPDAVSLDHETTATVQVGFSPAETGDRQALLNVAAKSIPLSGHGFDATISVFPWYEDFSDRLQGGIPRGWHADALNWDAWNISRAGEQAPEMVFWWEPAQTGRFYLITPRIDTQGIDTLVFSMNYRINNFQTPGQYTLSIITIADSIEHVVHQWVNPGSVGPEQLLTAITATEHGLGAESLRLAFVFDGITHNIVGWEFDDLELRQLSDTAHMGLTPRAVDFGSQSVGSASEPQWITIKNTGSSSLVLGPDDVELTGTDSASFLLKGFNEQQTLKLFESLTLEIVFSPENAGSHNAQLRVGNQVAELMGWGNDSADYFVYSDFTIKDGNRQYTNVGGFREIPNIAPSGSITATDVAEQGVFGGSVLRLDYDLDLAPLFTLYYMWAFPPVNLQQYTHMVLYLKAAEPISDLMIRLQDNRGVQGTNGGSFAWIDVGTEWQSFILPVNEFELMSWANELPDMTQIQKIDFLFQTNTTLPFQGTLWADLVGFATLPVATHHPYDAKQFSLFPNPARHHLQVAALKGTKISISDVSGRRIYSNRIENEQLLIDTHDFSPGIYLVEFTHNNLRKVKKVVIQ